MSEVVVSSDFYSKGYNETMNYSASNGYQVLFISIYEGNTLNSATTSVFSTIVFLVIFIQNKEEISVFSMLAKATGTAQK